MEHLRTRDQNTEKWKATQDMPNMIHEPVASVYPEYGMMNIGR